MNVPQANRAHLLLALACLACGACDKPLTVPSHEQRGIEYGHPVLGVTHTVRKYIDGEDLFFGEFADGEEWYMSITLNARHDDNRSSEQLLAECLHDSRQNVRERILAMIEECGGTVRYAEIVVFRDRLQAVGQYQVGMIVSLADFSDRDLSDQELMGSHAVFQNPIVVKDGEWYHAMVWQHKAGIFKEKQVSDPASDRRGG